jgi:hypothetical protein
LGSLNEARTRGLALKSLSRTPRPVPSEAQETALRNLLFFAARRARRFTTSGGFVNKPYRYGYEVERSLWQRAKFYVIATVVLSLILLGAFLAFAESGPVRLTASWYSMASLKKEGTFKTSKGVMANGQMFEDGKLTAATRLFPLGTRLSVRNVRTNRRVLVTVTDRIGKRFAKTRIDLSKAAFAQIAQLSAGVVPVEVEIQDGK